MKKIFFALLLTAVLGIQTSFAQTFFYKAEGKTQVVDLSFSIDEASSIEFKDPTAFKLFTAKDASVLSGKIAHRELSSAEKAISAGLWIITGFVILPIQDAYDLGADLKLLSLRGLIFFLFPFERHSLYRKCGDQEYLIATSTAPTEDVLKEMKSLEELHQVCDPQSNETAQPKISS
jgi:hypothetical protein